MKHVATIVIVVLFAVTGSSQTWSSLGSGFNNEVRTLFVDSINSLLYAGGNFTLSAGDTVNRIACWNGFQWNPMGDGFNARVMDIEVYNGEIYACGDFQYSDTTNMNYIARWNGTSWEDVGGGLDDNAMCMHVFNGNLYVGGWFENAGGIPCNYVAYWNGTVWNNVDTNITASAWPVQAIYSYQNELLIGGRFTADGTINNIARLVNGQWQAVGGSAVGDVTSMQEINGDLYVTGNFISIDSVGALCFAKWDGTSWYGIYGPMSSSVNCLVEYNNNIILGGAGNGFVNMGWGMSSPGIGHYNPSTFNWTQIDSGFGGHVYDLAIMNNTLYAGGAFTIAGNNGANRVAQLDPTALYVSELQTGSDVAVFPNPANTELTFQFGDADESRSVVIYNSAGQVVEVYPAKQNVLLISTTEFVEGFYFFKCTGEKFASKGKFVITH